MSFRHRTTCRVCGGKKLDKILSLGNHPPSNNFLSKEEFLNEKKYPLDIYFCRECSLVQLLDVVDPKSIFSNYTYVTGTSRVLVEHLKNLAERSVNYINLDKPKFIIDIGCNDGTLLRHYKDMGFNTLGIDPATNITENVSDINIINKFFGIGSAINIFKEYGKASIITATNVFAHIDNIDDVVLGVDLLLDNNGVFIIEVHYIVELLKNVEFDTIYHEHLCYFSLTALKYLFDKYDMVISDVEEISNHGGSLRVFIKKNGEESQNVKVLLEKEKEFGISSISTYIDFKDKVEKVKINLRNILLDLKQKGHRITAYGATAKGNTLLNYCNIDDKIIDYISDRTPFKIGKYSPGMHIPIISEEDFHKDNVNFVLLLAWNYKEDIINKEKGKSFIVPIPKVEICQKLV